MRRVFRNDAGATVSGTGNWFSVSPRECTRGGQGEEQRS